MIINDHSKSRGTRAGSAGRIAAEIGSVLLGSHEMADDCLREVAEGVAAYVAESRGQSMARSIHPRALASRALSSVGRGDLAGRLMVFGGGLVRRVTLSASGDVWVLDLGRLHVRREDRLDMMLMTCLNSILESMSHVWDRTGGQGALGLRNLRSMAGGMAGNGAKPARVRTACREIRAFCNHKLANMARERQWTDVPFLMVMDHG